MKLSFTKMQGTGNDFVVIDATARRFEAPPGLLAHLADRRFGVGCDQILVIEAPSTPDVDFDYRIFNADGSEVGQCGNGSRALARYVVERGLTDKRDLRVRTRTATMRLTIEDGHRVRVDMGVPHLDPAEVPLQAAARADRYEVELPGYGRLSFGAVSMGNPHAVLRVDDVEQTPVEVLGPAVQSCGLFPEGVNVGFLQVDGPDRAALRVFERGSGETLACGSGACAAMVVGRLWGLLDAEATLRMRGGDLRLGWAGEGSSVMLAGPAEFVFDGEMEWTT